MPILLSKSFHTFQKSTFSLVLRKPQYCYNWPCKVFHLYFSRSEKSFNSRAALSCSLKDDSYAIYNYPSHYSFLPPFSDFMQFDCVENSQSVTWISPPRFAVDLPSELNEWKSVSTRRPFRTLQRQKVCFCIRRLATLYGMWRKGLTMNGLSTRDVYTFVHL